VLEEGVAWFGDPGQGGPPDNDLEVKISVAPGTSVDGGEADGADGPGAGHSGGCSVGPTHTAAPQWASGFGGILALGGLARLRRRRPTTPLC
jgi:MYXO-CTERM domain-containing protein